MGWRQAAVVANLVIIQGPHDGLFVYNGTPATGNLVASVASNAGTDRFGNAYLAGEASYGAGGDGFVASQLAGGGVTIWTATTMAGPWRTKGSLNLNKLVSGGNNLYLTEVQADSATGAFSIGVPAAAVIYVAPSGDTSGAQDTARLNTAFVFAKAVVLLPGTFYVNNTITIPTGGALIGAFPVQADTNSNYGAGPLALQGAVISAAGAFTGAGPWPAAVIACTNTTATQQGGQVLANFSIEANTTPAASGVFGILLHGAVAAGVIDNVVIHRPDGACLRIQTDSGTGKVPDQWRFNRVICAASRSSHGVLADNIPDSTFTDCLSHNNPLNGWDISGSVNTSFIGCRGENNTNNGFAFHGQVSAGEDTWLTGCSTQLNQQSGFMFDAAAHTGLGGYTLTGCRSASDGLAAAGILAGFYDNGCKSVVVLTGCTVLENSGGTVPAYGAYEGSVAFGMALTGCRMQGVTAATHDDATNTHVLSNLVPVPF